MHQLTEMRFAILSDIHANLEALQSVLGDAKTQGCAQQAFLGDFVGWGPDPRACLDLVRALNASCVKGNQDEYCATDMSLAAFDPGMVKNVEWTRKQLSGEDRQWLRDLPYMLKVADFTIVHATQDEPQRWGYIFDKLAAASSLAQQQTPISVSMGTRMCRWRLCATR